jgi:hypothetical protein
MTYNTETMNGTLRQITLQYIGNDNLIRYNDEEGRCIDYHLHTKGCGWERKESKT